MLLWFFPTFLSKESKEKINHFCKFSFTRMTPSHKTLLIQISGNRINHFYPELVESAVLSR